MYEVPFATFNEVVKIEQSKNFRKKIRTGSNIFRSDRKLTRFTLRQSGLKFYDLLILTICHQSQKQGIFYIFFAILTDGCFIQVFANFFRIIA